MFSIQLRVRSSLVNRKYIAHLNRLLLLRAEKVFSTVPDFCWLDENNKYQTDWTLFSKEKILAAAPSLTSARPRRHYISESAVVIVVREALGQKQTASGLTGAGMCGDPVESYCCDCSSLLTRSACSMTRSVFSPRIFRMSPSE